jgi:hypothetical protein
MFKLPIFNIAQKQDCFYRKNELITGQKEKKGFG